jgi:hypothetical protein
MIQIVETTDKEKFEMYNLLEKDVLIGMLIECNKNLNRLTPRIEYKLPEIVSGNCGWFTSSNSGGRCDKCGKQQWEH